MSIPRKASSVVAADDEEAMCDLASATAASGLHRGAGLVLATMLLGVNVVQTAVHAFC